MSWWTSVSLEDPLLSLCHVSSHLTRSRASPLPQARAKLELRDTVFASDAQDVVGLLKASRYLSGGADESEDGLG